MNGNTNSRPIQKLSGKTVIPYPHFQHAVTVPPPPPPPTAQNFLKFMQFFGKSGKFVCWRPPPGGLVPSPTGNPGSVPA